MGTDLLPARTTCGARELDDVDVGSPDEEVFFDDEDDTDEEDPDDTAGADDGRSDKGEGKKRQDP